MTKVTAANLRFGLKLFADLSRREPNHNLVLSPSSVATALGLTYNGAAGETREAMARTLEIQNLTLPEFNRGHAALHRRMRTSEPDLRSLSANGLWVRRGVPLEPAFLRTAQEDYGAEVASLDFDDPKATEVINQWVAERTEGKISQVVGDRLGEDTLLCLMNAVYFQGQWQRPFDPTRTREGRFTLADGTVTRHPMMEQFNTFRYLEKQQFQAVNLPYGDGRLSMVLFLPRRGLDFAEFAEVLNPDSLALWMADLENAEETNVLLVLPRFQVQYEADLGGALKDLGMGLALDPMKADFRLMASSGPRVFIKRVQHKCFLTVDEKGTEAAGSTSVHMGLESAQKFHRMEVDRPFFFAIRNQETGDLLFVGSVFQPR
ncbi:MAG: serpin family protein [Planctomycetes bacterium]|nr:serpin family protein [Planctomycetota bacterium]